MLILYIWGGGGYYLLFNVPLEIFGSYGDVTIPCEGQQKQGLCPASTVFEQGGIFIVPHPMRHMASINQSHPKDYPKKSPFTKSNR